MGAPELMPVIVTSFEVTTVDGIIPLCAVNANGSGVVSVGGSPPLEELPPPPPQADINRPRANDARTNLADVR
jgi:hypothetical protein